MKRIYVSESAQEGNVGSIRIDQEIKSGEFKTVYELTFNNDIKFGHDFEKIVLSNGEFFSKRRKKDGTMMLERTDGTIIELEKFNNPILNKLVDKKILESFNKLFDRIKKEESYKLVYLTAHPGRSGISFTPDGPKNRNASMLCEIEIDDNGELTDLGKKTLDAVINKEFRDWSDIFITGEDVNNFKICYDNRIMMINSNLKKYVKSEAIKMEELYLNALESLNTEKR